MLNFGHFSAHLLIAVNKTTRQGWGNNLTFVIVHLILTLCLLSLAALRSAPPGLTLAAPLVVIISRLPNLMINEM